ncbi:Solute carrier family 25 member 44 [Auxenochlorella protothecoides]|uniref:Solute carrier family 25 member 44 n=1 Tax=Auxenochlorella protothecoides TaxID=3075 RepID=A0A087SQP5_AUXPR|nr:Solute carrier family 25 member 44 [Auxenochlorella protothecoides]KFM28049.1 Solute carrier family 25 member 44 [Auxenochlorella protothecoides]
MAARGGEVDWERLDKRKFFVYGGGLFSALTTCLYPLSAIKTRQMALDGAPAGLKGAVWTGRTVVATEGIRGLYAGFGTVIFGMIPARMLYMASLELAKSGITTALRPLGLPDASVAGAASFVGGGLASFSSHAVMGVRGLYRGLGASIATYVPSSAIWWSSYGVWQTLLWDRLDAFVGEGGAGAERTQGRTVAVQAAAGLATGCTSAVLTNPLDVPNFGVDADPTMLTRVRPLGAGLALCQRWTPAVVERLLSGAAASASDHEDVPERFNSRTKRDNRLRYFVVSNQPSSALRLLEQTVFRVPMVDTSGREKFLKLPPASVCNKVLDSAAQEAQLTGRAAELADALLLQGIPLEAKTLRSLVMGLAGTGRLEDALPFLDRWLAAEEAERGRAGPQGAAAPDDDERGDGGSAPLAAPSPRHVHRTLSWLLEIAARRGSTPGIVAVLSRAARVQVVPSVQSVTEREGAVAERLAATSLSDAVFRTCVLPGIAGGVEGATEGQETGRKDGGQALAALEALQSLGDTATPADRLAVLGRLVVLGDAAAAFALARHMPKEPAGAWWDERVERTVLHALKRAGQAGADKDEVAAGRALLDAR